MTVHNNLANTFSPLDTNRCGIDSLDDHTTLEIFSHLSEVEIRTCSLVSKRWNHLTENTTLWKALYQTNGKFHIYRQLEPLLAANILIGKEIGKISRITSFLSKVEGWPWNNNSMTNEHIRSGGYHFTVIKNKSGVEIYEVSSGNTKTLRGFKEQTITHLALDGSHLFALTRNGVVLQWNFLTGELVREIETEFSKGNEQFTDLPTSPISLCNGDCFIAQEGCIVICYGTQGCCNIFEVITGNDFTVNKLISTALTGSGNLTVRKRTLYGTFVAGIFSIGLIKEKINFYYQKPMTDSYSWSKDCLSIHGRTAIVSRYHLKFHVLQLQQLDLKTREWSRVTSETILFPRGTHFLEMNHFILVALPIREKIWTLKCYDLLSNEEVLVIEDLLKNNHPQLQLESSKSITPWDHIEKVVRAYKRHCREKRTAGNSSNELEPDRNKGCTIQ